MKYERDFPVSRPVAGPQARKGETLAEIAERLGLTVAPGATMSKCTTGAMAQPYDPHAKSGGWKAKGFNFAASNLARFHRNQKFRKADAKNAEVKPPVPVTPPARVIEAQKKDERIRKMVADGLNRQQIADAEGITRDALTSFASSRGIPIPRMPAKPRPPALPRGHNRTVASEARAEKLRGLLARGLGPDELCAEMGCSWKALRRFAGTKNIQVPHKPSAPPPPNRKVLERRKRVAQLVNEGKTRREIEAQLRITSDTARDDLRVMRLRAAPPPSHGDVQKAKIERVLTALCEGASCDAVAAQEGMKRRSLRRLAQKAGWVFPQLNAKDRSARQPGRMSDETRRQILSSIRAGGTRRAIGAQFGYSPTTINDIASDASLTRRTKPRLDVRRAEVARLVSEGFDRAGIYAAIPGITAKMLYDDLGALGLSLPPAKRPPRKAVAS